MKYTKSVCTLILIQITMDTDWKQDSKKINGVGERRAGEEGEGKHRGDVNLVRRGESCKIAFLSSDSFHDEKSWTVNSYNIHRLQG